MKRVALGKTYSAFQKTGSLGKKSTRYSIRSTGLIITRHNATKFFSSK